MAKYRNGNEVIDAVRIHMLTTTTEIAGELGIPLKTKSPFSFEFGGSYIYTPKGKMRVNAGDYIIKDVQGVLYPCKPDIFKETYEKA